MSNARFSILQARAVKDKRVTDSQFRTLAALGMYADPDGWCFPSLTTIGKDLVKSKQAVGRDTIALRKLGYLEVTGRIDPKTKARRSNLYRLKFDLPRQPDVDAPSTVFVDAPSTSEVDVNDPVNTPLELNDDDALAKATLSYQVEIGAITAFIADEIKDAIDTYPLKWILDAMHEAAVQNKRSWKYCLAILKRWQSQGNQEPMKKGTNHENRTPNRANRSAPTPEQDAASRALAERILAERPARVQ